MNLTIDQIRFALVRGDVSVQVETDGTITAVKVAPFDNDVTFQAGPFVDCPLPLFLEALIGDLREACPADRPWPGSWRALYEHDIWRSPED